MTLDDAFLQDILRNPDDDGPRLVYADWLDESGADPARAEFIRAQIELERLLSRARNGPARASEHDPRVQQLRRREYGLWRSHSTRWQPKLPELKQSVWWSERFTRGFQETVMARSPETFHGSWEELVAIAPVRSLKVEGPGLAGEIGWLLRGVCMRRIRELDLSRALHGHEVLDGLADSENLSGLQTLILRDNLGDPGAERLAGLATLPGLVELYLSGCNLGDPALVCLAESPQYDRLVLLDLRDNHIADAGLSALARAGHYSALADLWLVNNGVGAEGVASLACSALLGQLRSLWLAYNPVGDAGASALAASPHAANLEELDLRHCGISDAGARALARSPHLSGLHELALSGNVLSQAVTEEVRARFAGRP